MIAEHLKRHQYLVDEQFSFADLMLVSCIDWAGFYHLEIPQVLLDYKDPITERPAYQRAYKVNYPQLVKRSGGDDVSA